MKDENNKSTSVNTTIQNQINEADQRIPEEPVPVGRVGKAFARLL